MSGKAGLLTTVDVIGRIADSMLKKSPVRVAILYITDGDVRNYREDFTNPVINSSDFNDMSRRFPETLVQEKIARRVSRSSLTLSSRAESRAFVLPAQSTGAGSSRGICFLFALSFAFPISGFCLLVSSFVLSRPCGKRSSLAVSEP